MKTIHEQCIDKLKTYGCSVGNFGVEFRKMFANNLYGDTTKKSIKKTKEYIDSNIEWRNFIPDAYLHIKNDNFIIFEVVDSSDMSVDKFLYWSGVADSIMHDIKENLNICIVDISCMITEVYLQHNLEALWSHCMTLDASNYSKKDADKFLRNQIKMIGMEENVPLSFNATVDLING